jgi:hypothetical protein
MWEILIKELNISLNTNIANSIYLTVKSNVAIASAITSYSRIEMIPYKLFPGTVYTETDSIVTTDILPNHFIGNFLGYTKEHPI